jgi:hypothetical protein
LNIFKIIAIKIGEMNGVAVYTNIKKEKIAIKVNIKISVNRANKSFISVLQPEAEIKFNYLNFIKFFYN